MHALNTDVRIAEAAVHTGIPLMRTSDNLSLVTLSKPYPHFIAGFLTIMAVLVFPSIALGQEDVDLDENIRGSALFNTEDRQEYKFFTLTFQNDVFVGEDDGFTNGLGLTFGRGPFLEFSDENLPGWLEYTTKNLYVRTMPNKIRGIAHMFFQQMQTPEDITAFDLQVEDAPYAGLISYQGTMYAWDKNVSDQFSIFLGLVGPLSFADRAQINIHSAIGADRPNGWEHQLNNEPVFRLEARRIVKLKRNYTGRFGYDILGLTTVGFGNLLSNAQAGLAVRWGSNLEFTHATFSLQTDRQVNSLSLSPTNDFFFYAGFNTGLIFNDIMTDGNTFTDSHSLPLENFQVDATVGAVMKYRNLSYVFQLSSLNSRTSNSDEREKFGALSVTYVYQ